MQFVSIIETINIAWWMDTLRKLGTDRSAFGLWDETDETDHPSVGGNNLSPEITVVKVIINTIFRPWQIIIGWDNAQIETTIISAWFFNKSSTIPGC